MRINKYLFYFLLGALSLGSWHRIYAQQDPLFSQYMFSGIYLNPAIAGTSGYIETTAMHRNQWTNVAANPSVSLLNMNMPMDHYRMGIGGQLLKASYNDMQFLHFNLSGSYKINLGKNKLSMGIEAGTRYYHFSYDKLNIKDPGDKVLLSINSKLLPDVGAGIYYYSKKTFIGVSCKHINQGKVTFRDNPASDFYLSKQYFMTAGFQLKIAEHTTLKPMCLIKYINNNPIQADVTLMAYFHNAFWTGITIRSSMEAGVLVGFIPNKIISSIGDQWQIGCAFDYGFNRLSVNNQAGSYEVVINYRFKSRPKPDQIKNKSRITSPMLFGNSPVF
jgi:type IX secretion system PorP/SprF family membrane protein